MPARLQEHYAKTLREALTKEFSYKNSFEVPKLEKIVINMGVGEAVNDRKAVDGAVADLTAITGQKPVVTKSRKATKCRAENKSNSKCHTEQAEHSRTLFFGADIGHGTLCNRDACT